MVGLLQALETRENLEKWHPFFKSVKHQVITQMCQIAGRSQGIFLNIMENENVYRQAAQFFSLAPLGIPVSLKLF